MDWLDVILRALIFLLVLFIISKLYGKTQASQLSYLDFVVGITMGGIASAIIIRLVSFWPGIFGIITLAFVPLLFKLLTLKSKKVRDVIEGNGTVFIKDGKIMEENLKKEAYTTDKLLEMLRGKDVFEVQGVEFAVLEPSGNLSVLLKKENQPITMNDLGIKTQSKKEPQTVIMDGNILDESLANIGKNRQWLNTELDKIGVTIENVFLGQVDSYGQLTVDLFDDKIQVPAPQEKPLLLASLKKCQADLELFALSTESDEAKAMYERNAKKMEQSLEKLTPLLKN